ncbi:SMI1/KNR4 family protein [Clostridium sp. 'deep sea']|uniref:SMI1/KNR4 family protein n=1 Tax=Clostridium sp. 'deep sea' TaxID=2779445 RepID=UPI001896454D|nr:SMI1/KNR4 family protein [Clostridium sp. 'deep sea']QOR35158.1 SMI1/KNR4 family protein [Clostridium sp. 'deep sea']
MLTRLSIIKNNKEIQEQLETIFDFIINTKSLSTSDFLFTLNANCYIFATDGAGNCFGFLDDNSEDSPVLYVNHEGSYAVIANNLVDFLSTIVSHPYYWNDILQNNSLYNSEELANKIIEWQQEILNDIPDLNQIQRSICNCLNLNYNKHSYEKMLKCLNAYNQYKVCDLANNPYSKFI